MILREHLAVWSQTAPWMEAWQVEQDLIISRAIVEIFNDVFFYFIFLGIGLKPSVLQSSTKPRGKRKKALKQRIACFMVFQAQNLYLWCFFCRQNNRKTLLW